jgi:UDP-N-acetylmuramate dehydrogenase
VEWTGIKGTILNDVSMKRYTSIKVGGPVSYLIYPRDEEELLRVLNIAREKGVKYRFLGNGTNIIVHDRGLREAVIRTTRMQRMNYKKTTDGTLAEVSGGTSLKGFIVDNARHGLAGLEKLYWIPGTIGGGIKMNAGSFGSWISNSLESVRLVDKNGKIVSFLKNEMGFGYRESRISPSECVLTAWFHLLSRNRDDIQKDMDFVYGERKKRHPMEFPSAGSVFKGVAGEPAWRFIEKAGLKGIAIGGAMVSDKHANFIVNTGGATAQDVKLLIDKIKKEVFEKTGVTLEEEVEFWGFNG